MFALNSYPQVQLQISPGVFFLLHLTQRGSATISSYFKLKNSSCNFIHQHIHFFTGPDCSISAAFPQGLVQHCCLPPRTVPELSRRVHTVAAASFPWETFLAGSGSGTYIYALAYRKPWLLLSHMILGGIYYSTSRAL